MEPHKTKLLPLFLVKILSSFDSDHFLHVYKILKYNYEFIFAHKKYFNFSAGVGRTGVFISLSIVLERMQYEGVVDVFQTVRTLRTQRPAMVQTEVNCSFYIWLLAKIAFFLGSISVLLSSSSRISLIIWSLHRHFWFGTWSLKKFCHPPPFW